MREERCGSDTLGDSSAIAARVAGRGPPRLLYSLPVSASKVFTYEEARALLPEVRRRTEAARQAAEALRPGREGSGSTPRVEAVLDEWARSLLSLGVEIKGLWLVDFDNGSGYYCWQYPEPGLDYFHSYADGFAGRVRIH